MDPQDNQHLHRRTQRKKKHKRKHPVRKTILFILAAFVIAVLGYGTWLYVSAKNAINTTYKSSGEKQSAKSLVEKKEPLNILLMGADTGAFGRNYQGRTDTMIIATINPEDKQTTLTSIPRDLMAEMVGYDSFKYQRINAAYAFGGSTMALNSISTLLNVPLEYYVTINMGGLQKVVDAVGGVDVTVPFSFSSGGHTFTKGQMHLNGSQALAYSRMRKEDPQGDYGRQKRQRQVITSIINSATSLRSLTNFKEVLDSITDNIVTNLTFDDMTSIFTDYRGYAKTIKSEQVQGVSAWWGDASVQVASTTELQRVSDILRTQMGLKKKTLNNQATRQNKLNAANGFNFDNPTSAQNFVDYPPQ